MDLLLENFVANVQGVDFGCSGLGHYSPDDWESPGHSRFETAVGRFCV